jgi:hypothetical protein
MICINKDHFISILHHNSPIVRSLLAKIFSLFGKSLSLVFFLWFVFVIGGRINVEFLLEILFYIVVD